MPLTIKAQVLETDKHDYDITSLIFYNNKLYSGSDDGKIKVWDENLKLLELAQAHESSVFSLTIGNDTLYSCSSDGLVKSWSINPLEEKNVILQEESEIWKVCFNGGKLFVGDDAGLVKIFENNKLAGILEIMHPITELMAINNLVYTARDLYLLISEIFPDGKRITTIKSIEGRAPICEVDGKICFTSRNGKDIKIHENSKASEFKEIIQLKDAHELIINALCASSNGDKFLYSGGWDKIINKWKLSDNSSIEKSDSFNVGVVINALTTGPKNELYVGGGDGSIIRVDST